MAINPSTNANMVGRVTAANANYPFGSAKDETSGGANDGSPYFKGRADDVFGFQQSLLTAAGITPSGTADTALVSEYVQAIVEIAMGRAGTFAEDGASAANAYVIVPAANQQKPRSYFDGMRVTFVTAHNNTTTNPTVNVAGLGVKTIANASTGFIKAGIRIELLYRSATGDFIIYNTDRYVSGDAGFEIVNGTITQWGFSGDLGDISSGSKESVFPLLVPFVSSVDEAVLVGRALSASGSQADSVVVAWNSATTTLSGIGANYAEQNANLQNNWGIQWKVTGR